MEKDSPNDSNLEDRLQRWIMRTDRDDESGVLASVRAEDTVEVVDIWETEYPFTDGMPRMGLVTVVSMHYVDDFAPGGLPLSPGNPGGVAGPAPSHYCGYVQTWLVDGPDVADVNGLHVHGGVTYGPDPGGWVGFDCAHAFDVCLDESGTVLEANMERRYAYLDEADGLPVRQWSPSRVKQETEELARMISQLERGMDPERLDKSQTPSATREDSEDAT